MVWGSRFKKFYNNVITTDGFSFSGSGLFNDVLSSSGCVVPKNLRADEFLYKKNAFSWPYLIENQIKFRTRLKIAFNLLEAIARRIPLNIVQSTFMYERYLLLRGRGIRIHEPTSINRSLWAYIVNLIIILFSKKFNSDVFYKWMALKYFWCLTSAAKKNLLLDNGIPRHKSLVTWLYSSPNTYGFFVYRNPQLQFQQICEYYKNTGRYKPTYDRFLQTVLAQYSEIEWMIESQYPIVFISCDKLMCCEEYRQKLFGFLKKNDIVHNVGYDFTESIKNNNVLKSKVIELKKTSCTDELEKKIYEYHKKFENNFCKNLTN